MEISPQHQDNENLPPTRKRRRKGRRRLVVLAILAVLVLAAAFALNGPVFRAVLRAAVERGAVAADLSGTAEVAGTLLSGPRLTTGAFEGAGELRSVRFESLEVDYSLVQLARHGVVDGLTGIRASGLAVVLEKDEDAGAKEKTPDPADESGGVWRFSAIRNTPIHIENASFHLRDRGEPLWEIDGLDFTLTPGGKGELALARLLAPEGKTYESLHAVLQLNEASLEIADLALLDDVRIDTLLLQKHDTLPAIANGSLHLFGGEIAVEYTAAQHLRASLTEGAVDLAALDALLGLKQIKSGSLTALDARLLDAKNLAIEGSAAVSDLRAGDMPVINAARAAIRYSNRRVEVDSMEVSSGENRLTGAVAMAIPASAEAATDWLDDVSGALSLRAPQTESVLRAFEVPFAGNTEADLAFAFSGGTLTRCEGTARGTALSYDAFEIAALETKISCPRPGAPALEARIRPNADAENTVDAKIEFEIEPLRYGGTASAALQDIAALKPLLAAAGFDKALAGGAQIEWKGSGDLREKEHRGTLAFTETAVKVDAGEEIRGRGTIVYDPSGFDASDLGLTAGGFALQGGASLRDDRLTIGALRLSKGDTALADLNAALPFRTDALQSPRAFLAQEGAVDVTLRCETLSIEELYATLAPGATPPIGGFFSGNLTASGSLPELELDSALKLTGVAHPALNGTAPAEIDAAITVDAGRLRLVATARQELMEPVTVSGETVFTPRRWIDEPESWKNQEVALVAELPETDLAVFLPFMPAISRLQGNASAKVRVEGPAGAPRLSGSVTSAIEIAKFKRQEIPTINSVDLNLVLEGNAIRIDRGKAEIAGGVLTLGGAVSFESGLADPLFAVTLRADQALIARDDYLNLRANADLTLNGPFSAATLAGEIAISESRYVRDIEILPLNVLRRTPELPKKAGALRTVDFNPAITAAPFDAWIFDLRIVTADPFLIRGNLANATANADIAITGTGASPVAVGKVTLVDGEAKLPFSKLKIESGELVFEPGGGFIPRLNITGVSTIRQYEIRVRLYNSVLDPKVLLTSTPPLPQEEIATLLASGSTRDELGDREAVASKALQLIARETARKVFRRKSSTEKKELLPEDLELSVGQTDARTGRRAVSSLYRLTPNLFLIGTLDEGGDYRGLVKVLIRFR